MNQQNKREHWTRVLEKHKASNLSIKQFCIDNDINYQTFYYWSKKISEPDVKTRVQPIIVTEPCFDNTNKVVLTLNNGIRAELPANLNSAQIKHWIEALQ